MKQIVDKTNKPGVITGRPAGGNRPQILRPIPQQQPLPKPKPPKKNG